MKKCLFFVFANNAKIHKCRKEYLNKRKQVTSALLFRFRYFYLVLFEFKLKASIEKQTVIQKFRSTITNRPTRIFEL